MPKKDIHFLEWKSARMACGKRFERVYGSVSFWSLVTCAECLKREPLGEVNGD